MPCMQSIGINIVLWGHFWTVVFHMNLACRVFVNWKAVAPFFITNPEEVSLTKYRRIFKIFLDLSPFCIIWATAMTLFIFPWPALVTGQAWPLKQFFPGPVDCAPPLAIRPNSHCALRRGRSGGVRSSAVLRRSVCLSPLPLQCRYVGALLVCVTLRRCPTPAAGGRPEGDVLRAVTAARTDLRAAGGHGRNSHRLRLAPAVESGGGGGGDGSCDLPAPPSEEEGRSLYPHYRIWSVRHRAGRSRAKFVATRSSSLSPRHFFRENSQPGVRDISKSDKAHISNLATCVSILKPT